MSQNLKKKYTDCTLELMHRNSVKAFFLFYQGTSELLGILKLDLNIQSTYQKWTPYSVLWATKRNEILNVREASPGGGPESTGKTGAGGLYK